MDMKTAKAERSLVVLLFLLVMVIFSFAERDTKKLEKLYNTVAQATTEQLLVKMTEDTPENGY
ncbi:MAG TPA: hypothetical protein VGD26_05515 [Chitinophagaceae bacterium]